MCICKDVVRLLSVYYTRFGFFWTLWLNGARLGGVGYAILRDGQHVLAHERTDRSM